MPTLFLLLGITGTRNFFCGVSNAGHQKNSGQRNRKSVVLNLCREDKSFVHHCERLSFS